ncbi:MAG: flagellar motor switch protein FliN, partial [Planctomycetes bacterium]|nr:flagellar motor switch protein FliN [Planctomycetota bacterium]
MADEEVGKEDAAEETPAEATAEQTQDEQSAPADGADEQDVTAAAGGETADDEPSTSDAALGTLDSIESQLGEVLSNLDGLGGSSIDGGSGGGIANIDLLRDVTLNVKIELGRSRMYVEDILKLNEGSVVELEKLAGDPVDVFVNDRLVARGEVLVLNDNFCVRIGEIV